MRERTDIGDIQGLPLHGRMTRITSNSMPYLGDADLSRLFASKTILLLFDR